MNSSDFVNRIDELDIFRGILQRKFKERILLIEAPSGHGKTSLLLEFQNIADEINVPYAVLDVEFIREGVFEILATLFEEWYCCPFEAFQKVVDSFLKPTYRVDIKRNIQIGKSIIKVVLGSPDEAERRKRHRVLTEALMTDLHHWLGGKQRTLLLIDSYNARLVTPELRHWVEGVFLPYVRRIEELFVVIAGQNAPQKHLAWESLTHRLSLGPITNPEDWMKFVEAKGLEVVHVVVSAFVYRHNGHPLEVATALKALKGFRITQ